MTPLDLKTKEEWEKIVKRFSQDVNMTACLTDKAGVPFFCRLDRYPLCMAVRDNQEATTFICGQANIAMLAVVEKSLRPEVDYCDAGLLRIVIPIVHEGTLIGMVVACGLASDDEEVNLFLIAKQLGISENQANELSLPTPIGSEKELLRLGGELFEKINTRED